MLYLPLYLLLWPLLTLLRPFRCKAHGTLLIHTAKIGDYVNVTTLYPELEQLTVLIDKVNKPLAERDNRIDKILLVNTIKLSIPGRIVFGFKLFWMHYQQVLVTTPGSLNLFLGLCSLADFDAALFSPFTGRTARLLLPYYRHKVIHNGLTVESYTELLQSPPTAPHPYRLITQAEPERVHPIIASTKGFLVGLGVASGNRAKTIPSAEWQWLLSELEELKATLVVIGTQADQPYLNVLTKFTHSGQLISLLGQIPLQDLPDNLQQLSLFISADSGPAYIADSMGTPLLTYAGPCAMDEQRPLGKNNLIVYPEADIDSSEISHIFRAPYGLNWEHLYHTGSGQRTRIVKFLKQHAVEANRG